MHSTFVGANWTVRNSEDVAAACLFNFLGGGRSYTSVPKASFASAMRSFRKVESGAAVAEMVEAAACNDGFFFGSAGPPWFPTAS